MPTSLNNNQSMNNNARFRNNEQHEEDDAMTMESLGNSGFVLTNVPPISSFPFPTTTSDHVDGTNPYYNMMPVDIVNEMRAERSRDFERFFEEEIGKINARKGIKYMLLIEIDTTSSQANFPLRAPSPFSLPLPILGETPHQLPYSPSRENETDEFLERANQILSSNSNDFGPPYANYPNNEETKTIERARREAAPIMFPEEDEEPLLLYNQDIPNQHYIDDSNLNNTKEEEGIEGLLMVKREPFTVNHAEYIPSNDPEYKPQQFDEEMEELTTFQAMHNISLLPDNNDLDEINNVNNWLCFDTEMELEEFKVIF